MGQIQEQQASVGVLVGVRENGRPAALLQVRADHDSYARACQVTAHGKLTEDEIRLDESVALDTAIGRKLKEEIGDVAAEMVEAAMSSALVLDRTVNSKGRLIVTKGLDLNIEFSDFTKLIVPGIDVGGFRSCTAPEQILTLEDHHKPTGVPQDETRMFPDEIESVKKLFLSVFKIDPNSIP